MLLIFFSTLSLFDLNRRSDFGGVSNADRGLLPTTVRCKIERARRMSQLFFVFHLIVLQAYLLKAGIAFALALLNMRGLNVVGYSAGSLTFFVLLPLVVFCLFGFGQLQPEYWLDAPPAETLDWSFFLNMLLWTLSGYDNMGAVSGEIHQPAVTIPLAQLIAVIAGWSKPSCEYSTLFALRKKPPFVSANGHFAETESKEVFFQVYFGTFVFCVFV